MNYLYLLFLFALPAGFPAIAQKTTPAPAAVRYIRLNEGMQSLSYLFDCIMRQTDYKVMYDAGLVRDRKPVSVTMPVVRLDRIPELMLASVGLTWQVIGKTIVIQELPARSFAEGSRIEEFDSLVVYYTGYQELLKEHATGSFEQLAFTDPAVVPGATVLTVLEKSGSNILGDFRNQSTGRPLTDPDVLLIRGVNTLTKEISAPLIVVDDFIYEGDISDLSPAAISSVTVLKDAAAAGIWGARAGNGVVVLTTERSRYDRPVAITFSNQLSRVERPRLFRYPWLSSSDYIDLERYLFRVGFYDPALAVQSGEGLSPVVELLNLQRQGKLDPEVAENRIETLRHKDVRRDFNDYLYRPALYQQYALQITGGEKSYKYALFAGLDKQTASLVGNRNDQVTFRMSHTFKLSGALLLEAGCYITEGQVYSNSLGEWQDKAYDYGSEHLLKKLYPYAELADGTGRPLPVTHAYRTGWVDTAGNGRLADWQFRPLEELQLADNKTKRQTLELHGKLTYHPLEWLLFSLQYQRQQYRTVVHNIYSLQTYFTRNLVNSFTRFEGSSAVYPVPKGDIIDESRRERSAQTIRAQLTVNKRYHDKHLINILAGGELRNVEDDSRLNREYGANASGLAPAGGIDYSSLLPQYGTGRYARIPDPAGSSHKQDRYLSLYLNGSYTLDSRYVLSSGIRKDASNLFGVAVNKKWKPFWWTGIAWHISREPFYRPEQWPSLKFRVSYGTQGNVNNKISPLTILRYPAATNSFGQSFANIREPADSYLGWETLQHLNLGVDLESSNRRISGSVDWYNKKGENIIFNTMQDPTTGFSSIKRNSARMRTRGVEVTLRARVIDRQVKWQSGLALNFMRNIVTSYVLNDADRTGLAGFVENNVQAIYPLSGRPPYSVYSYPFAGLDPDTGAPLGRLGDQLSQDYYAIIYEQAPDRTNLVYHGSALPPYFGKWSNVFTCHRFSLATCIDYRLGHFYRKPAINYFNLYHYGVTHPGYEQRWKQPGDENRTFVPSRPLPGSEDPDRDQFFAGASVNVRKAGNIRLQYVQLSYQPPFTSLKKTPCLQEWKCFFTVLNPGILWKADHSELDPDYSLNAPSYPLQRSYTLGFTVKFKTKSN